MKPYYEDDAATIYHGDCVQLLPRVQAADLVVADPPYYRVKDETWDRQWGTADGFLQWLAVVVRLINGAATARASLYMFASPQMNHRVESVIAAQWRVLNNVRWCKDAGWHKRAERATLRSFLSPWESVIVAERLNELGAWLHQRRISALVSRTQIATALGVDSRLVQKWEEDDPDGQHSLITEGQFVGFAKRCGSDRTTTQLAAIYHELRRPFALPDGVHGTDIWAYAPVQSFAGKHPCEKPIQMLLDIIATSSVETSTVLDPFMGSGTTLVAAKRLGRKSIGIEREEKYCEIAAKRLAQGALDLFGEATA